MLLLQQQRQAVIFLQSKLHQATVNMFAHKKSTLANLARTLNAISPLNTLERGYSITLDSKGTAILSAGQLKAGDTITTRLHNGQVISEVTSSQEDDTR